MLRRFAGIGLSAALGAGCSAPGDAGRKPATPEPIGDRGEMERAQDLRDHAGKTLRLHADGRVPAGNPFVGRDDALAEIYTYGNRNAQGMVVHPKTGEIWQNEHGSRGGDEINRIVAGRNYGWAEYNFGDHYTAARSRIRGRRAVRSCRSSTGRRRLYPPE